MKPSEYEQTLPEKPEFKPVHTGVNEEMTEASTSSSQPSWFGPKRLLLIFCVINLLNYVDRGVIASNGVNGSPRKCSDGVCKGGTGIQGDFNLTNFEDGVLSSAFMVGLLVASPIFAFLAKSFNPFRLIGVGLSVWMVATALCGASVNFWTIAVCRMVVGVGEASFISLAAPFIDDNAPPSQKTVWLAAFYMCIPGGIAFGYVLGGLVASHLSWRWAFFGESILMVPFAILAFIIKPLHLKGFPDARSEILVTTGEMPASDIEGKQVLGNADSLARRKDDDDTASKKISLSKDEIKPLNHFSRVWKDIRVLFDKVYTVNVLGYVSYTFVIGAYSYWGPKAGYSIYNMKNADTIFGGVTIICGILGTLAGGLILDRMTSTIRNAFKVLSGATFLGAIFCFGAFCSRSLYGFIALFAIGELLLFAAQAPVNFVCLHCVEPSLRPLSMALNTILIHLLGDVPSSPLVGVLQDHLNDWRKTALILTSIFFLAAVIWFIGIFLNSVDKFNEESERRDTIVEKTNVTPLLEGSTSETR
ncbi:hypothetical protein ACHQM5_023130 [Ranunculus cassubicifolius]